MERIGKKGKGKKRGDARREEVGRGGKEWEMKNGVRKKGQEKKNKREGEESTRRKEEQKIRHHIWDCTAWSWCAGVKKANILEPE